jgi:hypothetical protein
MSFDKCTNDHQGQIQNCLAYPHPYFYNAPWLLNSACSPHVSHLYPFTLFGMSQRWNLFKSGLFTSAPGIHPCFCEHWGLSRLVLSGVPFAEHTTVSQLTSQRARDSCQFLVPKNHVINRQIFVWTSVFSDNPNNGFVES